MQILSLFSILAVIVSCKPLWQVEYNAQSSCRASYHPSEVRRVNNCLSGVSIAKRIFEKRLNRSSTHVDLMQATYQAERNCPREGASGVDCRFGIRLLKEQLELKYQ